MFKVPITHICEFHAAQGADQDWVWPLMIKEFAANGVKHLVLQDWLVTYLLANPQWIQKFHDFMDDEGLTFVDAHAPFGYYVDLNTPNEEMRRVMLERYRGCFALMKIFNVETVTCHLGNDAHYDVSIPFQTHIDNITRSIEALLPMAEELGITMCLENIWFRTNTPEVLNGLLERFKSPNLGLCYDAGHANLMKSGHGYGEDCNAWQAWHAVGEEVAWDDNILEKMLPNIVNCHLHDNDGKHDRHWAPGKGNIDWKRIAPLLNSAPRLKCVQCETLHASARQSIKETCEGMRMVDSLA